MPSKNKRLTKAELASYEAKRNLATELLQSVREMKAGQTHVVSSPAIEARKKTGLSQFQFAALIGVSVRTLQGWGARPQATQRSGPYTSRHREYKSKSRIGRRRQVAIQRVNLLI